jgi:hypothetical protein
MLGLKLGIQYVTLGFNEFLDWILEKVGGNNNSGVESAQRAVNTTRGEIDALWTQLQKDPFNAVTNFANDAADSLEDLGIAAREEEKATKDTTDSLNRLSASFTNAPQGFKYNWRSYQAQDAVDTGMAQLAGTGGTSVYVAGSIVTQNELHKEVEKYTTRRKFQKGG